MLFLIVLALIFAASSGYLLRQYLSGELEWRGEDDRINDRLRNLGKGH